MGYLDEILSYATGRGKYDPFGSEFDPYHSEDNNSDNQIEKKRRMLLGIHAPDLYPNINDPNADLYGSPSPTGGVDRAPQQDYLGQQDLSANQVPSNLFSGDVTGAPATAVGPMNPSTSPIGRKASIYEPGPNEAAYSEALRKPRPEYNLALEKKPWWQTALQIAVPSARGAFADPYKKAQQDYERRTGAYEGDIASKRGAANLEIGERDRQQRLQDQIADREQKGAYYQRGIKHYDYLENKPEKPEKKSDYEIFKEDPEGYTNYLKAKEKPDQSLSDYQYWKADHPSGTYAQFLDFKERTTHKYDRAAGGGAGGVADAAKLRAIKVAANNRKDKELLKLQEEAEFMSPGEYQNARQSIQDSYENEMAAGGHTVEHYTFPVEKKPEKPKPVEQPNWLSRQVGSIFGGGAQANVPAKPQLTPEQAAAELARRRGLTQ